MRKFVTITLAIAVIAQTFVQTGIVLYYHLNKTYISQQLCENRKDPSKNCNGRCYLAKQLKQAEEQERKQSQSIAKEKEELIGISQKQKHVCYTPPYVTCAMHDSYSFHLMNGYTAKLPKPPSC